MQNNNVVREYCDDINCVWRYKCLENKPARVFISCRLKNGKEDGKNFSILEWGLRLTGNGALANNGKGDSTFWDAMEKESTEILELFYLPLKPQVLEAEHVEDNMYANGVDPLFYHPQDYNPCSKDRREVRESTKNQRLK